MGCLQNKEPLKALRPLRSPKTPKFENVRHPNFLLYFFGGTSSFPQYPLEKSPFPEGGGEGAILVIFHVNKNRNSNVSIKGLSQCKIGLIMSEAICR